MPEPGDGFQQFFLSAARDACNAEDLAAVSDEAHIVQLGHALAVPAGQSRDRQTRLRIDRKRTVDIQRHLVADHHLGQLTFIGLRCFYGRDVLSFAQDCDYVRNFHNFV